MNRHTLLNIVAMTAMRLAAVTRAKNSGWGDRRAQVDRATGHQVGTGATLAPIPRRRRCCTATRARKACLLFG